MEKKRLVENLLARPFNEQKLKKVNEALLLEDGQSVQCIAVFTFPISRPDEINLNGRIYSSALWEKVIREKQGEGRYGVCDHPSEDSEQPDGSVKDIFCVWKNVRFSDDRKLILADAYLFGPYGKLMHDALQAGGEAGLSSVGFGDFLKDGTTIDPETYMLDRPSDWVMNPSYQVFGRIEDKKEESVEKTGPLKEEVKTDLKETRMSTNIEKSYEKTLSLSVNALLKDADKKESIFEKAEIYESALSCLEEGVLPELRKTIEDKIVEINASIKELAKKQESLPNEKILESKELIEKEVESVKKEVETANQDYSKLLEKYKKACQLADTLKEYAARLKQLYDTSVKKLGESVKKEELEEIKEYAASLEEDNKKLEKELSSLRVFIEKVSKENKKLREEIKTKTASLRTRLRKEEEEKKDPEEDSEEDSEEKDGEDNEKKEDDNDGVQTKTDVPPSDDDTLEIIRQATPSVAQFYLDSYRINSNISKIKEKIISCRTVVEAQKVLLDNKSFVEGYIHPQFRPSRVMNPIRAVEGEKKSFVIFDEE